jgi:hypothetical protein
MKGTLVAIGIIIALCPLVVAHPNAPVLILSVHRSANDRGAAQ